MIKWIDVIKFGTKGNPLAPRVVMLTEEEWKEKLTPEEYQVTRLKGTERPFSSEMCTLLEPGIYGCKCCDTLLFDSYTKFDSGTGWPSFDQPIQEDVVAYHIDSSLGMRRVEVTCNVCEAHLGHVFPDGPEPSGLRYCINALSLKKIDQKIEKAYLAGGCFWCTEAIFKDLKGVLAVKSGYAGGHVKNPTYKEVCSGLTGHAELIEVTYDPSTVDYKTLISLHLTTHDPTTLNRQGADRGTQYRSAIFYRNENEKAIAQSVIDEMVTFYPDPIVTKLEPLEFFYVAEHYHQNYYELNKDEGYCQVVIAPKVAKMRQHLMHLLK